MTALTFRYNGHFVHVDNANGIKAQNAVTYETVPCRSVEAAKQYITREWVNMQKRMARDLLRGKTLNAIRTELTECEAICGLVNLGIARIENGYMKLANRDNAENFLYQ